MGILNEKKCKIIKSIILKTYIYLDINPLTFLQHSAFIYIITLDKNIKIRIKI